MASSTLVSGRLSTSPAPLPTPFWFSGGGTACEATIIDPAENSDTYCCNGLLIDISQPILGPVSAQRHPFYFQNLRCCSADSDVTLGSVTSCITGSAASLATSVEAVISQNSSSGSQIFGLATSTSTVLSTSEVTTTATAATTSTDKSEGKGLRVGIIAFILTILSITFAFQP
ncbi:hypothetical protein BDZ45DRAFT_686920 [Acephala macrosclerotiorum]|nr:hypothetical protein BDZ45DRAFT_686920 [Acephala macrosclerotiorum]